MVLFDSAIQAFRNRKLRDLTKLKELSNADLLAELASLGARWHTKPYKHQKACMVAGLRHPSCYLLLAPGTGKTLISLNLLLSRKAQIKKCLVLVPGIANIWAWLEEIKKHAPELTAVGLANMTSKEKRQAVFGPEDVVVMTYMGWINLIGARWEITKRKMRNGKNRHFKKAVIDDVLWAQRVEELFQMLVMDEASALKNHNSLSFITMKRLMKTARFRYGLSGTPFDKKPEDLWSQIFLIDGGHSLGETLGLFRETFCSARKNRFTSFPDYAFKKKEMEPLRRRLAHASIGYRTKECLDLPKIVGGLLGGEYMIRPVVFPEENLEHYGRVLKELKGKRDAGVIKNVYTRLRQLTAGFIPVVDDGVRHNIHFDTNPKLEALLELLEEIPDDSKVIVFNEFKSSGELICAALQKTKRKHTRLFSGTPDKIKTMEQFAHDEDTKILVASRSVCFGLNLQMANYIICFESPDSTIHRTQLEHRVVRLGQTKASFIYDLCVLNSVDGRILASLREGKNLLDELMASEDPLKIMAGSGGA